jgi:chromosome segregation ATPase
MPKRQQERSPPSKKSKVELTEEEIAVTKLVDAFDGEIANHLPPRVVSIVKEVAPDCLKTAAAEREAVQSRFAEAIGASLKEAVQGLATKLEESSARVEEQRETVKKLDSDLEESHAVKERADAEVQAAGEASMNAQSALMEAQTALSQQESEEEALGPRKAALESQRAELQEVMDIARGPAVVGKKDAAKLQKALREVEAPDVLVLGVCAAVGKESVLEQQFVLESCKMLAEKRTVVDGELAAFDETAKTMAEKSKTLAQTVETLAIALDERQAEESVAKEKQKAAAAAIKEATKAQKDGKKAADKAESALEEAKAFYSAGLETTETFEFLLHRTIPEPMPEVAEETQEPNMPEVDIPEASEEIVA